MAAVASTKILNAIERGPLQRRCQYGYAAAGQPAGSSTARTPSRIEVADVFGGKKHRGSWSNGRIVLVQAVTAIHTASDFLLTP